MIVADQSDLLFSNIKHLFFQPSEKELMVLIHVNLKAPIMLGKKKTSVRCRASVVGLALTNLGRSILP